MNRTPTGRVLRTAEGRDLELIRTYRAPIEDVWASLTESERTARWFGAWRGEAGPGKTIRYTMGFEQGAPEGEMTILACEAPRHLSLLGDDASGSWHLEAWLTERSGATELRFVHHLTPDISVADVGPGWEYYLDMLTFSREGGSQPQWEEFYPAQKEYYASRAAGGAAGGSASTPA